MDFSLLAILTIGLLLGIKHAIEPDHIIAVSTIAAKSRSLWQSSLAGIFWGVGHTLTLFVIGLTIILLKVEIPEPWALSLEFLVGIMLVYLGVQSVIQYKRSNNKIHHHPHTHDGYTHNHYHDVHKHEHKQVSHVKSVFIGMVHGLAGSAAMALLTMTAVDEAWQAFIYILVFGVGTVIGMMLFTTLIGVPFVVTSGKIHLNQFLVRGTGYISIVFGCYYMYTLGVTEGLFIIWFQ